MNLSVKEAANLMNRTEQFIRIVLQRGLLPFGTAVLNPGGKYSHYISPKLFEEFTGIKLPDDYFEYADNVSAQKS